MRPAPFFVCFFACLFCGFYLYYGGSVLRSPDPFSAHSRPLYQIKSNAQNTINH